MGKDFTEFIQIVASENMLHQIAKVSTSVSLAMIQEYHNWLNS